MAILQYRYKKRYWTWFFRSVDRVGWFLRPLICRHQPPPLSQRPRLLVVRLDHLGDLLCSFPAIKALRLRFPQAEISLLVGPWSETLAQRCPDADRVVTFAASWFDRRPRSPGRKRRKRGGKISALFQLVRFARTLHHHHYDLAVDLRGDPQHILLAFLAGIPHRLGYADTGGGFLLTQIAPRNKWQHEVERSLDVVGLLTRPGSLPKLELSEDRKSVCHVTTILQAKGILPGRRLIVVHPGVGAPAKLWLTNRWAELCEKVLQQFNVQMVVTGAAGEKEMVAAILQDGKAGLVSLAGELSLSELIALIARADLLISADSVPIHLAAAVGTPVVVLFSSIVTAQEWRPWCDNYSLIQKPPPCLGCERFQCPLPHHPCMMEIQVEDVMEAVVPYLHRK